LKAGRLGKIIKLFSSKNAISPVLSSLLLTVVAVAAMALATTATYVISTNLKQNMSERLIVEDVWFNNATRSVNVTVFNVGEVALKISTVYINGTQHYFAPLSLEKGEQGWLAVSLDWTSDSVYYVKLVTTRGTTVGDYYVSS
jgi:hypothetical protein